jgi:hypothetical protein
MASEQKNIDENNKINDIQGSPFYNFAQQPPAETIFLCNFHDLYTRRDFFLVCGVLSQCNERGEYRAIHKNQ